MLKKDGEDQSDRSCEKLQVLHRVKEGGNILHKKGRRVNWIGHMRRNCFLKYIIGGTVEGKGRRGRRYKQLLDELRKQECKQW
jgi:hypothetical protein